MLTDYYWLLKNLKKNPKEMAAWSKVRLERALLVAHGYQLNTGWEKIAVV